MKVVRSFTFLGLLGVSIMSACGSSDDGTVTSVTNFPSTGVTGGGNGAINPTGGGSTLPPGGSVAPPVSNPLPAGAITNVGPSLCSTQTIDAYGTAPDMMIVLDRSLSMTLNNRWQPSKSAIQTITTEFDRLLSFGLTMFPGMGALDPIELLLGGGGCAGGEKVDVPMKVMNSMAIMQSINGTQTMGLTPTGAGLSVALQTLGDRKPSLDTAVKPGYVLLVTDGEPSCDPTVSPDQAQVDAALMAVRALKAANIPTYVIGYQIAANFQSLMNQLAMEGGTGMFHAAESGAQIVETFRQITKDVVKCSFELSMVPPNPSFVRVTIDKKTVALDAADGWVINGKTVTLQGGACATLKDGKGHALNAQIECNIVTPD